MHTMHVGFSISNKEATRFNHCNQRQSRKHTVSFSLSSCDYVTANRSLIFTWWCVLGDLRLLPKPPQQCQSRHTIFSKTTPCMSPPKAFTPFMFSRAPGEGTKAKNNTKPKSLDSLCQASDWVRSVVAHAMG